RSVGPEVAVERELLYGPEGEEGQPTDSEGETVESAEPLARATDQAQEATEPTAESVEAGDAAAVADAEPAAGREQV
ncbi:MAG: hypothetical protein M3016_05675, partial [Actinomycetota bacterium]|nr:hypothetical protein [Actinomycetota bacterium]